MKNNWYRKLSEYLWQILVLLCGAVFLIVSFIAPTSDGRIFATLNGIGVSLLLSGVLGIFVNVLFDRKGTQNEVFETWGIKNIYPSRAIANLTADVYQENAKKQVDIIAFGLSSWRQSKEQLIDNMLSKNVCIRIITMDPDSDVLPMCDRMEGKAEGATRESILHLQEFFCKTDARRKVKIKYHRQLPLSFYFRIDGHIFVGPYLYGKESQQMITYEFEKGRAGFDYYSNYFENLWSGNTIPKLEFVDIAYGKPHNN